MVVSSFIVPGGAVTGSRLAYGNAMAALWICTASIDGDSAKKVSLPGFGAELARTPPPWLVASATELPTLVGYALNRLPRGIVERRIIEER